MSITSIKNGYKHHKDGWNFIAIWGKPYERGLAH